LLVLAIAAGGYFAWPQLEPYLMNVPVLQKFIGSESPAPPAPAPVVHTPAAAPTPNVSAAGTANAAGATATTGAATVAPASATAAASPVVLTQEAANQLILKKTGAVYPSAARQKKLTGDVELQATVGKDGSVTDVKVVSGDDTLAHSASEAVRQWKYKPYLVNGQAVEFQTPVSINFKSTN
jgi:protein TonB